MNEKNFKQQLARSQKVTIELQEELKRTSSELLQLTLELDDRVADRTKALEESQKELRKHRDHLQELVEERTAKLKKLNKQLGNNLLELKASEERFRSLVLTIPDIIYRIDTAGKFLFLNHAVQRLGHDPKGLIGKHFSEIIFPPDIEGICRSKVLPKYAGKKTGDKNAPKLFDERKTGKRKTTDLEIRLLIKGSKRLKPGLIEPIGKEVVICEVNSSGMYKVNPRTKNKVFIGTVGVIRNISERKEAEKAIQEMQEQLIKREKMAVLGQLAGGMSHDLLNPLGTIKTSAYFLKMALEEPGLEIKKTLDLMDKEVRTSEKIINSLFDYTRYRPPVLEEVNINNILLQTLSHNSRPETITVINQLNKTLPQIYADPTQLVQIFRNIILNAFQAMPEGGRLVIKSKVPSPRLVDVSFIDTGGGIPEKNIIKLFEPLFTTKAKGIGLGLAITKALVEGHGGTIKVESEVGKGSAFTIRLPFSREEKEQGEKK